MLNHSILLLHPLKLSRVEYLRRGVHFLMSVSKKGRKKKDKGGIFFFNVVSNVNDSVIRRGWGIKSSSQIVADYL